MNPNSGKENEQPADAKTARPSTSAPAPAFDSESKAQREAAEFRENTEGGYGWGV